MESKEETSEEYWRFGETSLWNGRVCYLEDVGELDAECL